MSFNVAIVIEILKNWYLLRKTRNVLFVRRAVVPKWKSNYPLLELVNPMEFLAPARLPRAEEAAAVVVVGVCKQEEEVVL